MGQKIKMLIEVDFGEDLAVSLDDPESVQWFGQEVLMHPTEDGALYLHSNELGDTVGRVRVLVVHDWPPRSAGLGGDPDGEGRCAVIPNDGGKQDD